MDNLINKKKKRKMRERKYKDGTCGGVNLPYNLIPDNYDIKSCLTNGYDLSYTGFMKSMIKKYKNEVFGSKYERGSEFQNKDWYSQEIIVHQAYDFLASATFLRNGLNINRGRDIVSHYVIPCAYCCRHAVELYLKYCALAKGVESKKLICHKITDLWNIIDEKDIPRYDKITAYIQELDIIDENGMALRYGLNKAFDIPNENFQFNVDIMICNAMYLINVLDEFVILPYKYNIAKREIANYGE